jgi:uncharacterized RDD family membrane protein YckC
VRQEAPLAGFWVRFGAWVIDIVLLALVFMAVWPRLFDRPYLEQRETPLDVGSFAYYAHDPEIWDFVFPGVYFTLTIGLAGGSIGMRVFRLRVVDRDGRRVGLTRSLARWAASLLSQLVLFLGFVMIAFREDKRALHDLIAGTWVVRR